MAYKRIFYNDLPYTGDCLLEGYAFEMMVIIPAFAEEQILDTIDSLVEAQHPDVSVGLLVVINEGERANHRDIDINERAYKDMCKCIDAWNEEHLSLHCIYVKAIPHKWAGVGMARRIAIEQAVNMVDSPNSPIVNLDADCSVSSNYLKTIYEYFKSNKNIELVNIHFEHPIESDRNDEFILLYESHLRYFIEIQRYIGLPYAYHTVGSSFAVRANAYLQVGGMNKRKAGEDFYFIHKFTKKGTIAEMGTCTVYPSARISTRVPFGTGRAMLQLERDKVWLTYHPESFRILRHWLMRLPEMYKELQTEEINRQVDVRLVEFLESINAYETIDKIRANVTRYDLFLKSFFQWFDGFMLMKYLHYVREYGLADMSVTAALDQTADELELVHSDSLLEYLIQLRLKGRVSDYKGSEEVQRHYSV